MGAGDQGPIDVNFNCVIAIRYAHKRIKVK